ncbi:UNVERIFIED_ORG: uncharacterized protein DUF1842 [Zoogloea ramigera]|uniref:DUF1842 domain-containing protein n=1 Tax=Duganella zoogloeoides TaxID=75659 RepID=A0ABZ0Y5D5_9BURK|nr:DUF1842 domain-containing protein [Duganella zoogloeoides]WQH06515.1 DUF1842 domain-containing protein [Duganella zoogloeoides]
MSTEQNPLAGAYLVKGTIGNVGMPGAPIVNFALVVVPSTHSVTGSVHVTQAVQNGSYSGQVKGSIYATGFGDVTQVVGLTGVIHPDGPSTVVLPFEAHLAINGEWNGTGGFNYANVHVENVPVARAVQ